MSAKSGSQVFLLAGNYSDRAKPEFRTGYFRFFFITIQVIDGCLEDDFAQKDEGQVHMGRVLKPADLEVQEWDRN